MITTANDVKAIRAVAMNVDPNVIEPYIEDVEKQDIIPAIGASLYFRIEDDRDNKIYHDFLHGGRFTNCDNCDAYSRGLIVAVAYLTYARMVESNGLQVTAFGVVKKETAYSSNASDADVSRTAAGAKKIGLAVLDDCIEHAQVLFGDSDCCPKGKTKRYNKFVAIKKVKM